MEVTSCTVNVLGSMLYASNKWEIDLATLKAEAASSIINQTGGVASILESILGITQPFKWGILKIYQRRTRLKTTTKWSNNLCSKDERLEKLSFAFIDSIPCSIRVSNYLLQHESSQLANISLQHICQLFAAWTGGNVISSAASRS